MPLAILIPGCAHQLHLYSGNICSAVGPTIFPFREETGTICDILSTCGPAFPLEGNPDAQANGTQPRLLPSQSWNEAMVLRQLSLQGFAVGPVRPIASARPESPCGKFLL